MKKLYNFNELNKWYHENKKEILALAGFPVYESIYSQALKQFRFEGNSIKDLEGDIFTVTFKNL